LKTQQSPATPSVNAWLQRFFLIATGLSFIASVQLFALVEQTDQSFSWTIAPPLMAAFLEAGYWPKMRESVTRCKVAKSPFLCGKA
jgi:hypothetical protein